MNSPADSHLTPVPSSPTSGKTEKEVLRHRNPHALLTSAAIIVRARDELAALTGYKVDSVSGFERTNSGWQLSVTVVELRRIPASTDILAIYEATLNEAGEIVNYHRGARYCRSQISEHQ